MGFHSPPLMCPRSPSTHRVSLRRQQRCRPCSGVILGNTLQDRIIAHQDRLDRSLEPLEDGLNNGDTAAITRAKELRKEYEAAIGADGEALLVLVEEHLARLQKKGGFGAVSLCVNPAELGGCTGNDSSKELISLLQNDRKFAKAMGSL